MALTPAQSNVALASATDLYSSIHAEKGYARPETHGIGGVTIKVCRGVGDPDAQLKVSALRAAIYKLSRMNLPMPADMLLYTSVSHTYKNVAFQRQIDGSRKCVILLGSKLKTPMQLPVGVARHVSAGGTNIDKFITAVCVHEIGHVLHEIADENFFWTADTVPVTQWCNEMLSPYAGISKREFVAEAFTAKVFEAELAQTVGPGGLSDGLRQYYRACSGPTFPGFMDT